MTPEEEVCPQEEQAEAPAELQSLQITEVSNGFITELSRSSQPEMDDQDRVQVHPTLDDLTTYIGNIYNPGDKS